ncbi:MAG: terminase small subunit [Ruminococcus sp.]|nr:terminase small subunit [Ruminococcus sp.]
MLSKKLNSLSFGGGFNISKLTGKQIEFCRSFVYTGDPSAAAIAAGYAKNPGRAGEKLLSCPEVTAEIQRICEQREKIFSHLASLGYQRLAFGSISDAVSLLYLEHPTAEQLRSMDLFMVSEIKKPKDGMLEIKFFDRLKALEKLATERESPSGVSDLFDAIGCGAKAVNEIEQS